MRSVLEDMPTQTAHDRLVSTARAGSPAQRLAAVRLLSRFGGPASRPALIEALGFPELRPVALDGVLRLSSIDELAQLARESTDVGVRRAAMASLVRPEPRAVDLFLAMVLDASTRPDVLASVAQIDPSAASALLKALDHPRVDYRFAAAKALGALCPHGIAPELRRMVERNRQRREALAALLCCEDRAASDFLAAAAHQQPEIESQIRVVRMELNRLF
jgi:HEAT repeat protein